MRAVTYTRPGDPSVLELVERPTRRWKDEEIPKTQWDLPHFLWFPAAELYGIQRVQYLDDVLVLSGAGVGGGSDVIPEYPLGRVLGDLTARVQQ